MVTTSSSHLEIIALYEVSRECVWLRPLIQHIRGSCGIVADDISPTILYEDNAACVTQLNNSYVKGNLTTMRRKGAPWRHSYISSQDIS